MTRLIIYLFDQQNQRHSRHENALPNDIYKGRKLKIT